MTLPAQSANPLGMKNRVTDPAENLSSLIRCPSVTPAEGGALTALAAMLEPLGFKVTRAVETEAGTPDIENLMRGWARMGPHLMFAGIPMSCRWATRRPGRIRLLPPRLPMA